MTYLGLELLSSLLNSQLKFPYSWKKFEEKKVLNLKKKLLLLKRSAMIFMSLSSPTCTKYCQLYLMKVILINISVHDEMHQMLASLHEMNLVSFQVQSEIYFNFKKYLVKSYVKDLINLFLTLS